jgi:predicted component of type VI protein secretion system
MNVDPEYPEENRAQNRALREYGDLYNRNLALHVMLLRVSVKKKIDHAEKEDLKQVLAIVQNRSRKVHNFFRSELRNIEMCQELAELLGRLQTFARMNVRLCDIISNIPVSQKTECEDDVEEGCITSD